MQRMIRSVLAKRWWPGALLGAGFAGAIAGAVVIQVAVVGSRLDAAALDPDFCSPSALHTTVELPESQLTRDFAAIRLLLKEPTDHFNRIAMIYEGRLQLPELSRSEAWLVKRGERSRLQRRASQTGTLKAEMQRIDRLRDTALVPRVEAALANADEAAIAAAFREMFAVLLGELLASIESRLDDPILPGRLFPHVRRYFSEGFEAHLALRHPETSRSASASLDAMSRAIGEVKAGNAPARERFSRERLNFVRVIGEVSLGEPGRSL